MISYKLKFLRLGDTCVVIVCEGFVGIIFNIFMKIYCEVRVHLALFCSRVHVHCVMCS